MRKITIIALLLFVMCTSCDWYCYNPDIECFHHIYLYKYNTGEQYIDNVKVISTYGPNGGIVAEVIPYNFFKFYHKGYIEHWGQGDAPDTSNFFVLSITYDELYLMNEEWETHFQDYVISNIRISEMYTTTICHCSKRPCFYENFPFCYVANDGTIVLNQTTTNQMIDDETIWNYFERII